MNKKNKFLIILPIFIGIILMMLTITTKADSGQCGENINYTLENGVLTVSGTGILDIANSNNIKDSAKEVTTLIIEDGITEIASDTFNGFTNLHTITLPSTLLKIGDRAFRETAITNITLPDNCKEVGDYAFESTKSLISADIRSAETVGIGAFKYSNVSEVELSKNIEILRGHIFSNCTNLTEVILPEGLLRINGSAFYSCTNLTDINYPSTLTYIGTYAFAFTKISSFDFPDQTKVGSNAFIGVETPKPVIIKDLPYTTTINNVGDIVKIEIQAEGYGLTYNWYYKNAKSNTYTLSAQHTPVYQMAFKESNNGRQMYCVVRDVFGHSVKTNTIKFIYNVPEINIISQPKSVFVNEGDKATISVKATGSNLTYEWYYRNTHMAKFAKSACTKDTYTLTVTKERDCRQMYCVITDSQGKKEITRIVTFAITWED